MKTLFYGGISPSAGVSPPSAEQFQYFLISGSFLPCFPPIFPTRRPRKARWLHTETAAHRLLSLLTQHLPTRTHAPGSDRYCKQKYLQFIRGFPGYFLTGFMHGCSPLPRCCSSASSHAHTSTRSGLAIPWWDAAAPCPASLQAKGKEWDEIFSFYC